MYFDRVPKVPSRKTYVLCTGTLALRSARAAADVAVVDVSYQTKSGVDAKNMVVEPDMDLYGSRVDGTHHSHLLCSLLEVILVEHTASIQMLSGTSGRRSSRIAPSSVRDMPIISGLAALSVSGSTGM